MNSGELGQRSAGQRIAVRSKAAWIMAFYRIILLESLTANLDLFQTTYGSEGYVDQRDVSSFGIMGNRSSS